MGDDKKKKARRVFDPSDGGQNRAGLIDPGGEIIQRTTGNRGARSLADLAKAIPVDPRIAAEKAAKAQSELIGRQRQRESARLAEAESALEERRLLRRPGRGGRSLLVATSPTGTRARTLGGA